MRARWVGLAAVAALAPVAASGCGGSGAEATEAAGNQLAVYSSLPLQGPTASISREMVNGEKLALADAKGRAGPFKVAYVSLDDSGTTNARWDPGVTASNAKTAAQDASTIAYIGDYNSAATAVSLPLINAAGLLQVSPASPYVGLTSSLEAGQDEPERFYPTGRRTFGRLVPGDIVEAQAQVRLMQQLGVHRLYVLDDLDPFAIPLADLVVRGAKAAGIDVVGRDSVATHPGAVYSGAVEKITASHPQAVFAATAGDAGAAALWHQLHAADASLLLLGSSTMATEAFTSQLDAAQQVTYLTTPALATGLYPLSAQRVLAQYRKQFGTVADAYALYGYEAMSAVLAAIRSAGRHGNDRQDVINRFFAIHNRASVLGVYSIMPNGDTTLSRYGVDRVVGGRPVFLRELNP